LGTVELEAADGLAVQGGSLSDGCETLSEHCEALSDGKTT
jgi:hypothetical protein